MGFFSVVEASLFPFLEAKGLKIVKYISMRWDVMENKDDINSRFA